MKTEILKISGMRCGSCTNKVTNVLKVVPGVSDVNVSLSAGEATLHYDEQLTSHEQLKAVVMEAGYSVDSIDTAPKPQGKGCCCN